MSAGMALAAIASKSYDEAVIWGERALVENRRSALILRALVVAHVNSGNVDRARQVAQELLVMEPNLTVTTWRASVALINEDLVATYAKALRAAGVAEHAGGEAAPIQKENDLALRAECVLDRPKQGQGDSPVGRRTRPAAP